MVAVVGWWSQGILDFSLRSYCILFPGGLSFLFKCNVNSALDHSKGLTSAVNSSVCFFPWSFTLMLNPKPDNVTEPQRLILKKWPCFFQKCTLTMRSHRKLHLAEWQWGHVTGWALVFIFPHASNPCSIPLIDPGELVQSLMAPAFANVKKSWMSGEAS